VPLKLNILSNTITILRMGPSWWWTYGSSI